MSIMSPFENMFKSSLQTADATAMSFVAISSATCARIMIDRIHVPPCTKTIPLSCRRKPSRPPLYTIALYRICSRHTHFTALRQLLQRIFELEFKQTLINHTWSSSFDLLQNMIQKSFCVSNSKMISRDNNHEIQLTVSPVKYS